VLSGDRRGRTRVGDGTGAGAGSALPVLVGRRRDVLAAAGGKVWLQAHVSPT
jgi:hypothetical protein